jgi:hypothetical protein
MNNRRDLILVILVFLVVVTAFAVLAANLGWIPHPSPNFATWGLASVLAEIMALFVFVSKWTFRERKPSVILVAPRNPPGLQFLDITQIDWVQQECFVRCGPVKKQVSVVPDLVGSAFRVLLPDGLMEKLKDDDLVELELVDAKGNHWHVRPFLPLQTLMPLSTRTPIDKISRFGLYFRPLASLKAVAESSVSSVPSTRCSSVNLMATPRKSDIDQASRSSVSRSSFEHFFWKRIIVDPVSHQS